IRLGGFVFGGLAGHRGIRQRASVELPLLAAAVEQFHVLVPVQLEIPVRVGGEPVVIAAVQDNGVFIGDTAGRQQVGELATVDEVASNRILQIRAPVELDRALDVPAVVGGGVLVYLDEHDARGVEVFFGPVDSDQDVVASHPNPFNDELTLTFSNRV